MSAVGDGHCSRVVRSTDPLTKRVEYTLPRASNHSMYHSGFGVGFNTGFSVKIARCWIKHRVLV